MKKSIVIDFFIANLSMFFIIIYFSLLVHGND
ncbi:hypothetical protein BU097_06455 [Staphylococcus xylosus]|uniref:Uncharacterized protein n=1 Tax=Staphylococcus xylosus TaxID=1288 RepID=A0A418IP18_STAXY|nr:hypothetical protein BU096_05275 [Staphylococcus xylosus]RIN11114.1 hypothetical protein BU097_06455 [Staphylococcus xylosus]TFV22274.1 hypothetical protein E4T75_11730 [Staphylococcus saprophyticus]